MEYKIVFQSHYTVSYRKTESMAFKLLLKLKDVFIYLPTAFRELPISSVEADTHMILCYKLAHLLFVFVIKSDYRNASAALNRFMLIIYSAANIYARINIPQIYWPGKILSGSVSPLYH